MQIATCTTDGSFVNSDGVCSECGVFREDGGEVLVLSGIGLDVEDVDHHEIFLMQARTL